MDADPDPDGNLWINLLLLVVLILLNAFFAMSEIAVITLNDNKVKKQAKEGNKAAKILAKFIEAPSNFLATIQVGVTLSGFLASAVAADSFVGYVVAALPQYNPQVVSSVSLVVITIILSFFTLIFGELVPKRVAMRSYESLSFRIAGTLRWIYIFEKPFVALLSWSTNGVLRLMGINPDEQPEEVTEEEIRMMVDVGNESGTIEESEKDMINNIFEFDDRTAEEVMTHRTDVTAIAVDTPIEEIISIAVEEGYSRIPVYREDLDDIIGILYVKDLLSRVLAEPDTPFALEEHMRTALYVPESTRCKDLLRVFKEKKLQMAVVVDEYGGTSGIVTMEDLLESIVGSIQDEYDDEEEGIHKLTEDKYTLDGITSLDEVENLFDIHFPEDADYDTIGGFIIEELGRLPEEGEHPSFSWDGVNFTVLSMEERRIDKVSAERIALPEEETDQ